MIWYGMIWDDLDVRVGGRDEVRKEEARGSEGRSGPKASIGSRRLIR